MMYIKSALVRDEKRQSLLESSNKLKKKRTAQSIHVPFFHHRKIKKIQEKRDAN